MCLTLDTFMIYELTFKMLIIIQVKYFFWLLDLFGARQLNLSFLKITHTILFVSETISQ